MNATTPEFTTIRKIRSMVAPVSLGAATLSEAKAGVLAFYILHGYNPVVKSLL